MNNSIDERIRSDQIRYLNKLKSMKDMKIVIFGAGRMAKPMYSFLRENNLKVAAFCVSDKKGNKDTEYGVPIIQLDLLDFDKEKTIIILGVNPRLNGEIISLLKKYGFTNFIEASEYIRYYGEYQYDFYVNPMIEITTKMGCAVNCRFCPQDVLLKNYFKTGTEEKMMSLQFFKKCIDKLPKNVLIEFAGFTEPFFNPECMDMIEYAKKRGFKVNMFTTLRGVDNTILDRMIKIQFEEFVLHVPDKEKYANIPITKEYIELIDVLVKAKKPNGDEYIDYACSQGHVDDAIQKHLGNKVRVFISLLDRAGNIEDESLFGKRNIKGEIRCETSCTINHNVLLPDGRIVLCAQDYGMQHIMGNLDKQQYNEIIHGNEAKRVIKGMQDEDACEVLCRNCSLAHTIDKESANG